MMKTARKKNLYQLGRVDVELGGYNGNCDLWAKVHLG